MTYVIIWAAVGMLTLAGYTVFNEAVRDLHIPGRWRAFALGLPLAALFGPLMLVGVWMSRPRRG
jgi:hypothetical protein